MPLKFLVSAASGREVAMEDAVQRQNAGATWGGAKLLQKHDLAQNSRDGNPDLNFRTRQRPRIVDRR